MQGWHELWAVRPERRNAGSLLRRFTARVLGGGGGGGGSGACLAPWKQGSKSWKPSQPGQETARYELGAEDTLDAKWIESRVDRRRLKAKLRAEAR